MSVELYERNAHKFLAVRFFDVTQREARIIRDQVAAVLKSKGYADIQTSHIDPRGNALGEKEMDIVVAVPDDVHPSVAAREVRDAAYSADTFSL